MCRSFFDEVCSPGLSKRGNFNGVEYHGRTLHLMDTTFCPGGGYDKEVSTQLTPSTSADNPFCCFEVAKLYLLQFFNLMKWCGSANPNVDEKTHIGGVRFVSVQTKGFGAVVDISLFARNKYVKRMPQRRSSHNVTTGTGEGWTQHLSGSVIQTVRL